MDPVVVRLPNWLGDTVMAVPAIRALRAAWPGARLMLAGPWASLLAGQGLADVLVTYPRTWSGRLRSADAVRRFAPALAVLLPNSTEAALAAWYWGAGRRLGLGGAGRSALLTDLVPVPEPRLHQVDEYLRLVEHLGLPVVTREPALAAPAAGAPARVEAERLLEEAGVGGRRPRIGVHLGAAYGPAKLWPPARVRELAGLVERGGGVLVLLGPPGDAAAAAAVTAAAPACSVVGRDRPELLPAVLAQLDVLVAGDTGVGHLATALGVPVVALFGPTDPRLTAPRGPAVALSHPVPCAPCFYRVCPIEHPCLDGVTAAQVRDAAQALLEAAA